MRYSLLRSVALAAGVLATAAPRAQAPAGAGTITGRVTLSHVRGTPLPSNVYAPRAVGNRQSTGSVPEIKNVLVYVKGAAYRGTLPTSRQQVVQQHESFVPRVLAITRGSTVEFPNSDPFFHNVFSLSAAASFDLGRFPKGQTRGRQFTKPGLVKVYCQIHSHMSASILVLDHPFFATPASDGTYSIRNVPAGAYTLVGWHERVGERTERFELEPGQTAVVNFALPVVEDRP